MPADTANAGWQSLLHSATPIGNALRSATITLTQIFNPLGVFGPRGLVVAKSVILVVSNAVLCFSATTALAFLVFAVRRRFRLAQ